MCQMKFQLNVVCVPGNVTKGFKAAVTVIAVFTKAASRIQRIPCWSDEMHICEISVLILFLLQLQEGDHESTPKVTLTRKRHKQKF